MKYWILSMFLLCSFFSFAGPNSNGSNSRTMQDCDRIELGGTFPTGIKLYEAALKIEGVDTDGRPYVQFVVVVTTNKSATDDELFALYKPKRKPTFKSVFRAPTEMRLGSELLHDCENWIREDNNQSKYPATVK